MKFILIKNPDAVHAVLEKMTNPALPKREVLGKVRSLVVMVTEKTNDTINSFRSCNNGRPYKDLDKGYNKRELTAMLLSSYCNFYAKSDTELQAKELQELRKICAQMITEVRKKVQANIGGYKLTKQLMAAAILHRVVSTQDLKTFFDKML